MSESKRKALDTLERIKQIYEDGGDLLSGGFYSEFMQIVNKQIKEISETIF